MIADIVPDILSCGFSGSRSKPTPATQEDLEVNLSNPNVWITVYCNFANGRASDLALNHFMAAWHKDQLGAEAWDDCCRRATEQRHQEAEGLKQEIRRLQERGPVDNPEVLAIHLSELQESLWRHESRCSLMDELQEIGLYCEDVPGDGDCALHTLVELSMGKPKSLRSANSSTNELALQKMRLKALRQEPSAL